MKSPIEVKMPAKLEDSLVRLTDTLNRCLLKAFSGRFLLAVSAAYGVVYLIRTGREADPFIASVIGAVVAHYYDKRDHGIPEAPNGQNIKP
jgi:hypothetical protein